MNIAELIRAVGIAITLFIHGCELKPENHFQHFQIYVGMRIFVCNWWFTSSEARLLTYFKIISFAPSLHTLNISNILWFSILLSRVTLLLFWVQNLRIDNYNQSNGFPQPALTNLKIKLPASTASTI